MLTTRMKQLQDLQVKKATDVLADTAALPLLKEPGLETSPVDIQDWMELLTSPMSDLSDGSASWWKDVVARADDA